jgi:hypothetical protein
VIQDVRRALMGHSTGKDVNAIYTHVELPIKREAIRKLELWLDHQRNELREKRQKEQSSKSNETEANVPACNAP